MSHSFPNFDRIARPYRWLESVTLGHTLERARRHFLPLLRDRTTALILGDGDGRFLASLFAEDPRLHADAVDISGTMLRLLHDRCPVDASLRLHQTDVLTFLNMVSSERYDLVVTHFFLDCFTQSQVTQMAFQVASRLVPGAIWAVTDFTIPSGKMRLPASVFIRTLYLAFRLLTGLRVSRLPDHQMALKSTGFTLSARHLSLFGTVASEVWIWNPSRAANGNG